jgi:hypothetical protein
MVVCSFVPFRWAIVVLSVLRGMYSDKEGDYEYSDMVDQLNEVIPKYEETYDTLLCGDMNASLHRDDRRRDSIFKNFTIESNLILPTNYPIDYTFHHHNGKGNSLVCIVCHTCSVCFWNILNSLLYSVYLLIL